MIRKYTYYTQLQLGRKCQISEIQLPSFTDITESAMLMNNNLKHSTKGVS